MRRKLVKQGDNALTITVPAAWTKVHKLTPGAEIEVRQEGQELILSSGPAEEKTADITINEGGEGKIRTLYREGYDRIIARFLSPKTLSAIQRMVGNLYGFETTEITTTTCTISSVHDEKPEELQSHVQRMMTALSVLRELIRKQRTHRKENEHITQFRDSVVKQADLIVRIIRKHRLIEELLTYEKVIMAEQEAERLK